MSTFSRKITIGASMVVFVGVFLLAPDANAVLRDSVNLDGGGGGGGGYYTQDDVQIPEITTTPSTVETTEAVNGNNALSSYQYSVQLNKTLWYAWNRWASGCGVTTGCLPSSDTSTQGWVSGLSNPNITIGYDVGIYDATTNVRYAENASVPVGTQVKLVFGAYVPNNIYWFGTGYSMDSPYGEWRANAAPPPRSSSRVTCNEKDYIVKYYLPGYGLTFDVYIPFVVNPPARSISSIPSGLSCGTLTSNADGTASMLCTVTGTGTITPQFHFDATYGKFYYRYYDFRTSYVAGCYGNNIPMVDTFGNVTEPSYNSNTSVPAGYQVTIPIKNINYPIVGVPSNGNPSTPALTCATSGQTGQSLNFTFTGTDPDNDTIRYGVDWTNAGSVNQWIPASGYVTSGTARTVGHTWNAAGTYTVRALTQDSVGGQSGWASCTVTITAPPPTVSCSTSPNPASTGQSVTMSSSVTGGSGNFSYAWSDAGGSIGTGASASKSYSTSGTKTITLQVTDNGAVPTASLTLSPATITQGQSSTLAWSSTNATSCSGTGFATGGAASGSITVNPGSTTTYTLTCTGDGGNNTDTKTLTVNPAPTPTASLSASPTSVGSGGASTLTWSSANTSSCTGTNFSTNGALSGTATVNPLSTTQYSLACSGTGGSVTKDATVTVVAQPTATVTANPTIICPGEGTTITWTSTNATSCTGTNMTTSGATSGTRGMYPSVTTSYGVNCTGPGGTAVAAATVTVRSSTAIACGGDGGGGGACFSPETLVTMADGSVKDIDAIRIGDKVLGEDAEGNRVAQRVTYVFVHKGEYKMLRINDGLVVTPEHMMWVIRDGQGSWRSAGEVVVGDAFEDVAGEAVPVTSITVGGELPTVYNLETYPHHTYFAGGVLVHNAKQLQ